MSTVRISSDGTLSIEAGRGVDPFLPAGGKELRFAEVGSGLKCQIVALRLAAPPSDATFRSVGRRDGWIDQVFGSPSRDCVTHDWVPTTTVVDDARAWVLHKTWQEGFNEPTFGTTQYSDHHAVVGAAFFKEQPLAKWAGTVLDHPIGQQVLSAALTMSEWRPRYQQLPLCALQFESDDDVRQLPGIELTHEGYYLPSVGCVQRNFWLYWHGQSFVAHVDHPEVWEIWLEETRPLHLVAKNGHETHRLALPDESRPVYTDQNGTPVAVYKNELPDLPEFVVQPERLVQMRDGLERQVGQRKSLFVLGYYGSQLRRT